MVPDPDTACVGLEYFCFEGDDLWTMGDDDLVALATRELEQLGLAPAGEVAPRLRRARPEGLSDVRRGLLRARRRRSRAGSTRSTNFQQVGRNGLHRYNNSDHSMLSAMRAVDNVLHGADHDIWAVNVESAYHEEQTDADARAAVQERPGHAGDAARSLQPSVG